MLVETPYISCHIATKCVHNKRRWSSMYSIEVWSVLSDLGKLCIAGHRFYPCVIPLWWNSNSLHMLVPPCIYIYIYTPGSMNQTTNLDILRAYPSQNLWCYPREAPMFLWQNSNQDPESSRLLAAFLSHDHGPQISLSWLRIYLSRRRLRMIKA